MAVESSPGRNVTRSFCGAVLEVSGSVEMEGLRFSDPMRRHGLTFFLSLLQCIEAKKYCWYFEGGYPIYFICRSYEDCCGTRCCVRALSIQRLWYFWLMLMMGVLFCCGAGIFFRRCIHPSPLSDEHAFNVSFTRQPVSTPVSQQPGMVGYGDPGGVMTSPLSPVYPIQPGPAHMMNDYPPPPSYCNHPPPPYEQIFRTPEKK
ncbi:vesicular, overexpressed in cancer, prosurvival protein 1-like [Salvelinus namaycush]|uniref:WW domain binding protein VOPP1 n=1 Tax=Salvelinus namaycush TaxID=8040 RepID=A0A8U0PSE8_SALNM|nr:vesicular, overexpressed in cancer, prosurvival protein 1-like [Salvelinus namaycush]